MHHMVAVHVHVVQLLLLSFLAATGIVDTFIILYGRFFCTIDADCTGTTYVRWGLNVCPQVVGTSLLYSGRASKTIYSEIGGGINYQCLPNDPEYLDIYEPGESTMARAHGVTYYGTSALNAATHTLASCAVCYVQTRGTVVMLPAKTTCPACWTKEYEGYLMAERHSHPSPSTFECVDVAAEGIQRNGSFVQSGYFVPVEARCGTLPCGPYDPEKELACVVCTK